MANFRIYTDGSFLQGDKTVHGGILFEGNPPKRFHIISNNPVFTGMNNVGGELISAWYSIYLVSECIKRLEKEKPDEMQINKVQLVYDYVGVGAWLNGTWSCKKEGTALYRDSIMKILDSVPSLELILTHVKGHQSNLGYALYTK